MTTAVAVRTSTSVFQLRLDVGLIGSIRARQYERQVEELNSLRKGNGGFLYPTVPLPQAHPIQKLMALTDCGGSGCFGRTRQCGSLPKRSSRPPLKNVVESGGLVGTFPVSPNDVHVAVLVPRSGKKTRRFPRSEQVVLPSTQRMNVFRNHTLSPDARAHSNSST